MRSVSSPRTQEHRPLALELYIGSFRGPSYGVWWDGKRLIYESFDSGYEKRQELRVSPSRAQWRRFWQTMDGIEVWNWAARYEPSQRYEPDDVVRDGTHWSLTLAHAGQQIESSGDDAAPDASDLDESGPFRFFCDAVARLVGGRPFS